MLRTEQGETTGMRQSVRHGFQWVQPYRDQSFSSPSPLRRSVASSYTAVNCSIAIACCTMWSLLRPQ